MTKWRTVYKETHFSPSEMCALMGFILFSAWFLNFKQITRGLCVFSEVKMSYWADPQSLLVARQLFLFPKFLVYVLNYPSWSSLISIDQRSREKKLHHLHDHPQEAGLLIHSKTLSCNKISIFNVLNLFLGASQFCLQIILVISNLISS